ncbi:MAG: hypothetical protein LUQ11_14290, partial [Methylococcaceae bacterium]|nr:hypothetical protein [Methylococcaceae bacterium]
AIHLSGVCGEKVTEADILHLALQKHIELSVYFINMGTSRILTWDYLKKEDFWASAENGLLAKVMDDLECGVISGLFQNDEPRVSYLKADDRYQGSHIGVSQLWDFAQLDEYDPATLIRRKYQEMFGGAVVTDSDFVLLQKNDTIVLLQENIESPETPIYRTASKLPEDCFLVVRTKALRAFEQHISEEGPEENTTSANCDNKPDLLETERQTLLKLVLGMAIDAYSYNPDANKNKATGENNGSIKAALDRLGISVDADTIRKYLNEAKGLLPPPAQ